MRGIKAGKIRRSPRIKIDRSSERDKLNRALLDQASKYFPGGVNSPVRSFKSVGGTPIFINRGKGAYIYDESGKKYIDLVQSWGPAILGHAHPEVVKNVKEEVEYGLTFGAPTRGETLFASIIQEYYPCLEMMRMVNSGTEACLSALRLARGFTGRKLVVKFSGGYHGHADSYLVEAGSGAATLSIAGSSGVPKEVSKLTAVLPYNDLDTVSKFMEKNGKKVAAIIVEPFAGNCGFIEPEPGFLEGLRRLTEESGALLIFDEVMTGFRVAKGGAVEVSGVTPDLITLGKVVGGGMPLAVYGGRKDIMSKVAPLGDVYQAGTLSGNPVAVAAGATTLLELSSKSYRELNLLNRRLQRGLQLAAKKHGIDLAVNGVGGMFGIFFGVKTPPKNYAQSKEVDQEAFKKFFHLMLDQGVYLPPSPMEAIFLSFALDSDLISEIIAAADRAMGKMSADNQ